MLEHVMFWKSQKEYELDDQLHTFLIATPTRLKDMTESMERLIRRMSDLTDAVIELQKWALNIQGQKIMEKTEPLKVEETTGGEIKRKRGRPKKTEKSDTLRIDA